MKIAVSGKGGTGKSTLAAVLALLYAQQNRRILAVDADPDANLAAALGIPPDLREDIVPISCRTELIKARTGAEPGVSGSIFKLNPDVSDIADRFALQWHGISLLVLGGIQKAGTGCACPENVLLRSLVSELVLHRNETLILDMEAGVEHLGRGTAGKVDVMIIVVEPGSRAVACGKRIRALCLELGIRRFAVVGNRIRDAGDEAFLRNAFADEAEIVGLIPYIESIHRADQNDQSVLSALSNPQIRHFSAILEAL